jgi:hypothetical protein
MNVWRVRGMCSACRDIFRLAYLDSRHDIIVCLIGQRQAVSQLSSANDGQSYHIYTRLAVNGLFRQ